jgi:DNA-binding IclR family transcriptional regulator
MVPLTENLKKGDPLMNERDSLKGTIVRCIRLIEQLAEADGAITVSKLATQLNLAPSTTHRILNQLRHEGFVSHNASDAAYRPGPGLIRIAALIMASTPFQRAYVHSLEALNEKSDETSFLAIYLPAARKMRLAHVVATRQPIQYVMQVGVAYSLLFGASGRAISAFLPEDVVRRIYEDEANDSESTTRPPPLAELVDEFAKIRAAGYAISSGQRVPGAHAIVAPIFTQDHAIMGAIGLSMPVSRADAVKDATLLPLVRAEAQQLSLILGDIGSP